MFQQIFNWRTAISVIAIGIVSSTIFYSIYVSNKIAKEERSRVTAFGEALKIKSGSNDPHVLAFTNQIALENDDIPIIETNEKNIPTGVFINLDTVLIQSDASYLQKMVQKFSSLHDPVQVEIVSHPLTVNKYFYGESKLQNEVRFYPIIQLIIVAFFIFITFFALRSNYRSLQNQVWAGMAKETAHQLGTPVTSLEGWIEILSQNDDNEKIVEELKKDVNRLRLVSDRFGKIGSTPRLEIRNIIPQITAVVDYMKRRAPEKIQFTCEWFGENKINANISATLFDWVIENLLKNSLDAIEAKGNITLAMQKTTHSIFIDVTDTGKGIERYQFDKVFKPGFTTKKRGWGLGLSLSRRIIEQSHHGKIFIKYSELGKGTTFRIVLKNENN